MKKEQTIDESLNKIKFMMNYDSSKTLIEQLESPGGIAGKTGIAAGGAALAGGVAGGVAGATAMGGSAAYGAVGIGTALGYGSLAAAGAVGGAVIAGAAALALAPLVLWLADKDKAYPKTKKLFDYVKANKDKIDQVERGLDDDTIQQLSDNLYDAMKGLGTRNKMVFQAFASLVTISDFAALIATFNEDHFEEGKGDLLEWLDSDIDISSTWNKIYVPLRNIVKKFAKKLAAENPPAKADAGAGTGAGAASGGYSPVAGTNEQPYKLGTSGAGIFKVQECLGFTGAEVDGKFGPKTQSKMMELAKQYVNGFTDADVQDICKMANARTNMGIAGVSAMKPVPMPSDVNSSLNTKNLPAVAPPIKTTGKEALAPAPKMQLSPLAPKPQPLTGRAKRIAKRTARRDARN